MPEPINYPYDITTPTLPIESLEGFFDEIEGLFNNIAGPWSQILFMEDDREQVAALWAQVRDGLSSVKYDLFYGPNSLNFDSDEYKRAGLFGTQLQTKLNWLSDAWKRFKEKGTVKALKELLKWVNLVLGSLATAFPGVEFIKEFKEAIELLIDKARSRV